MKNKRFYQKSGFIVLFMFLLPPVGIFLMLKYADWPRRGKINVTAITLCCFTFFWGVFAILHNQQMKPLTPERDEKHRLAIENLYNELLAIYDEPPNSASKNAWRKKEHEIHPNTANEVFSDPHKEALSDLVGLSFSSHLDNENDTLHSRDKQKEQNRLRKLYIEAVVNKEYDLLDEIQTKKDLLENDKSMFLTQSQIDRLYKTEGLLEATPVIDGPTKGDNYENEANDFVFNPENVIGISDKNIDDAKDNLNVQDVRNDNTGNWRKVFITENIDMKDYAISYYEKYFKSNNEVHFIVNFTNKTTTRINCSEGMLFVAVHEYVDKEEHDAKTLGGGLMLKEYIIYTWNNKIEEVE